MTAIRIRFGAAHAHIKAPDHPAYDLEPLFTIPKRGGVKPRHPGMLSEIASWLCKARGIGPSEMPMLSESVTRAAAMPNRLLSI